MSSPSPSSSSSKSKKKTSSPSPSSKASSTVDGGGKQDKPDLPKMPWQENNAIFASPWVRYFATFNEEHWINIAELAKREEYEVHLKKWTGKKIKNPFTNKEEEELSEETEMKNYARFRITYRDWKNLEAARLRLESIRDPKDAMEIMFKVYEYCAFLYFHMSADELMRSDWQYMKAILDACKFATDFYGARGLSN